jgi:hypothetical protein
MISYDAMCTLPERRPFNIPLFCHFPNCCPTTSHVEALQIATGRVPHASFQNAACHYSVLPRLGIAKELHDGCWDLTGS